MELLGKILKDKITGFEGVATSKHFYLTGCAQFGIQQKIDKDGKIPDVRYFDEGRLEVVSDFLTSEDVKGQENGCDFREHP